MASHFFDGVQRLMMPDEPIYHTEAADGEMRAVGLQRSL